VGKRRHAASGRLGRGCPRLRLGPQKARAAPPPASSLQLFRRRRAALRQAAAALHHTRCTCRAACRLRVPVEHAADRRLRGRKITGLPARARHDERRAPPWPVRSRAYHLNARQRSVWRTPVHVPGHCVCAKQRKRARRAVGLRVRLLRHIRAVPGAVVMPRTWARHETRLWGRGPPSDLIEIAVEPPIK